MYVARTSNGGVILAHYLTAREEVVEDVAAIVWVGSAHANGSLADELRDAGVEKIRIRIVGDAYSPRRLPQALVEAHAAAARDRIAGVDVEGKRWRNRSST